MYAAVFCHVSLLLLAFWRRRGSRKVLTCGRYFSLLERKAYNSCRDLHCQKCQYLAKARWVAKEDDDFGD